MLVFQKTKTPHKTAVTLVHCPFSPPPLQSPLVTRRSCPPIAPSILQFRNNPGFIVLRIYLPLSSFDLMAAD